MVRRFGITTERAGVLHHIWDTSNFLPNLSMTLFLWVVLIVCLWGCGFAEIYDPRKNMQMTNSLWFTHHGYLTN